MREPDLGRCRNAGAGGGIRRYLPNEHHASLPARVTHADKYRGATFEEHVYGVIDLEGENEEDDAKGMAASDEHRQFLAEVDRERQEQLRNRPHTGAGRRLPSRVLPPIFTKDPFYLLWGTHCLDLEVCC